MKHAGLGSPSKLGLLVKCQYWPVALFGRGFTLDEYNDKYNSLPQKVNEYAMEGTRAHTALEDRLNGRPSTVKLNARSRQNVDEALEYIRAIGAVMVTEQRVKWSDYIWGTSDVCIYHESTEHLDVIDFKNGSGVGVTAEDNYQIGAYGAAAIFKTPGYVHSVGLWIVQPSHPQGNSCSRWRTDPVTLFDLMMECEAALADIPTAEANPGTHCDSGFCPARDQCQHYQPKEARGVKKADIDSYLNYLQSKQT